MSDLGKDRFKSLMLPPIYEPRPLPRMYGRSRAWLRPTFLTLALIAVITGAAIGMTITI